MIEQITKLLQFGKIGSAALIGIAGLMLTGYSISKIISIRPERWLAETAIEIAMDGARFYVMFLTIEILAEIAGIL